MSIFESISRRKEKKRRRKDLGIGTDPENIISIRRGIPSANASPIAYDYTEQYASFISGDAGVICAETIVNTSPDDLNADMLDAFLDAHGNDMQASARLQYHLHIDSIHTIYHKMIEEVEYERLSLEKDEDELAEVEELLKNYCKPDQSVNLMKCN